MKAIDRKVLRDLMAMKAQLLAVGLVLTCGVGLFVGMRTTMRSLETARARYYAHERFAHVFATCSRAPEQLANRLRHVPGVTDLETRVRADVTLDVPRSTSSAHPAISKVATTATPTDLHFHIVDHPLSHR